MAIDDWPIPSYRVTSDPVIFDINIEEENRLGLPVGINRASADGYWIFLKPFLWASIGYIFMALVSGESGMLLRLTKSL